MWLFFPQYFSALNRYLLMWHYWGCGESCRECKLDLRGMKCDFNWGVRVTGWQIDDVWRYWGRHVHPPWDMGTTLLSVFYCIYAVWALCWPGSSGCWTVTAGSHYYECIKQSAIFEYTSVCLMLIMVFHVFLFSLLRLLCTTDTLKVRQDPLLYQ